MFLERINIIPLHFIEVYRMLLLLNYNKCRYWFLDVCRIFLLVMSVFPVEVHYSMKILKKEVRCCFVIPFMLSPLLRLLLNLNHLDYLFTLIMSICNPIYVHYNLITSEFLCNHWTQNHFIKKKRKSAHCFL